MIAQSRKMSMVEACTNIAIGYGVNFAGQIAIYPIFGIHVGIVTNLAISGAFTGLSLARSYALRRVFERILVRHHV